MGAFTCCRNGCLPLALAPLLAALSFVPVAHAEASSQAELTCALNTGDLLNRNDPPTRDEPPWQGLASLARGDESRARLALATSEAGFLPHVTTDAVLRLELALNEQPLGQAGSVRDASSSVGLVWQVARGAEAWLRAFPFDTNYLRLGYLHALDWGGTDAAHGDSVFLVQNGAVPGVQLGLRTPRTQLFMALKWAQHQDALRGEQRSWGLLAGGSVDLLPSLRVDGGFGYFQRPALTPLSTAASFVEGASVRVVWHRQATEPELAAEPFRPPPLAEAATRLEAEERPGIAVGLEAVALVQRLRRFEQPDAVGLEPAPAAALYGSVRGRTLAAHAVLSWRSLAFVLRNDAGLARGETLPVSALAQSELTAWWGASATVRRLHLVPSLELGVRLPAALTTVSALPGFAQSLIATGPTGLQALPVGAGRLPVVSGRLGARFRASASVALAVFGEYQRNPNRVTFADSPSGVTRAFARPDSLTGTLAIQARF